MERDSMVIYRSFAQVLNSLPDKDAGKLYKAITNYAMFGIDPELSGSLEGYFNLMKPQIDANNKRYENGLKGAEYGKHGGRPKTPKKPPNNPIGVSDKNPIGVSENNPTGVSEKTPNENENENVNENVNEKESKRKTPPAPKHQHGEYKKVLLTDDELEKLKSEFGESRTNDAIKYLDEYIADKGYQSKCHYLAMRRWVFDALDERKGKKPDNRLGTFGDYKQTSTDDEWDELMHLGGGINA